MRRHVPLVRFPVVGRDRGQRDGLADLRGDASSASSIASTGALFPTMSGDVLSAPPAPMFDMMTVSSIT